MSKHIYIGVIPEIFGYGMSVCDTSEERCMKALEEEHTKWVSYNIRTDDFGVQYHEDGTEKTWFEKAFDYWGGRVEKIELGKCYHDNFGG